MDDVPIKKPAKHTEKQTQEKEPSERTDHKTRPKTITGILRTAIKYSAYVKGNKKTIKIH